MPGENMQYREDRKKTEPQRTAYLQGIEKLIRRRQTEAAKIRKDYIRDIFTEPEKYRQDLKNMLGWPLTESRPKEAPRVVSHKLAEEADYCIYRLEIEILPELSLCGLLFRQHGDLPQPLVILQHGGAGKPEMITGLYGDTSNYNNMAESVLAQGVHAFAPQLLIWSEEKYGVSYNRQALDARLKRVGSSIAAVEIYGIRRALDYFETMDWVSAFGMVGMSYGGFYTLYTAAVDTRIRACVSCSFFNLRDAVPWQDWVWFRMAEKFDDPEIACLIYPRRLCIEMGKEDPLFAFSDSEASFEKLRSMCAEVGTDWVEFISYDGNHEFCREVAPIQRMAAELRK